MKKPSKILFTLTVLCTAFSFGGASASETGVPGEKPGDLLIVANKSIEDASIQIQDARAIFLKQRKTWPTSGSSATPFNAKDGSEAREIFLRKVLNMTAEEESRFWQKQRIVAGLTPPPVFSSIQRAVFAVRGSIGYVLRKDYTENVSKILLVVPE